MIRLQRCADCGAAQYPPREVCGACLSDRLASDSADSLPARVLARTRLHHSNEPRFRARLPLTVGLVQFDAGPVAVCFLAETAAQGDAVQVRIGADDLLEAA
ncbi:MAG TPA: zinc ribbon domain-containing protein [Acetobacteraceae bacterium]|nr:zinc ribbon domain-containing protein [Acetobacteraceae bacterium]